MLEEMTNSCKERAHEGQRERHDAQIGKSRARGDDENLGCTNAPAGGICAVCSLGDGACNWPSSLDESRSRKARDAILIRFIPVGGASGAVNHA
jgi:hypothetical protein